MPMKKILPLYLLCGICATACVDESYDLNKIDTGNIAIGDESSLFEIPLVKVLVGMDNLNSDDQTCVDAALALDKVDKMLDTMQVVKTIVVKNKLVNVVLKPKARGAWK